jgi:uncharacterized protein YjbI with pentapeptide repeats
VVIAGGGLWFNAQQRAREQQIANERAQDEALQAYLDQMSQLLTDKDRPLLRSQRGDNLSVLARARTLTALAGLDGERKRSAVQLLYESGLITRNRAILDLNGANLRGADLRGADLSDAMVTNDQLKQAYRLEGATMPNGQKYEDWVKSREEGDSGS